MADFKEWLEQQDTKDFFSLMREEKDKVLENMLSLTESGEELTKAYYQLKGEALGIESVHLYAQTLSKESE